MTNITAILVIKDNPIHLSEVLSSIDFVSEIIIVDIGINAQCKQILKQFDHVQIREITEEVTYVEQIREKTKTYATNEYILFLDPDEVISEDLKKILIETYKTYDFISIPRKNIIFGKWIQYARWWPDNQVRLFKKDALIWPKKLHAQPEVKGNGYTVEAKEEYSIKHYNYETITEYLNKMIRYAQAEANELIELKKIYTVGTAISEGIQEFISRFFAEKGYKDGMHGLVLSLLQMVYKLLVYFYYWEGLKYPIANTNEIINAPQMLFRQGLYETNYWLNNEQLTTKITTVKNKIINRLLK